MSAVDLTKTTSEVLRELYGKDCRSSSNRHDDWRVALRWACLRLALDLSWDLEDGGVERRELLNDLSLLADRAKAMVPKADVELHGERHVYLARALDDVFSFAGGMAEDM